MTDTELLELSGIAIRHGVLNVYGGRSDADTQRLVDKMLNDPAAYYTVAPLYPALRIYAELRERVAAKSCGSAIQAVKRIIRTCSRNDMRGVWKSDDGSAWCCCDGQREVRLKNVSGVPVLEQSFPTLEEQIDDCAKTVSKSLPLPYRRRAQDIHRRREGRRHQAGFPLVLVGRRYADRECRVFAGHGDDLPRLQGSAVSDGAFPALLLRRQWRRYSPACSQSQMPRI